MNREVDYHTFGTQQGDYFCKPILATSHCHAVARDDHNALSLHQHPQETQSRDLLDRASWCCASCCGSLIHTKASEEHVDHGSVDSAAHDVTQECATRGNQGPTDCQQVVGQHESCSTRGKTTEGVQQRDNYWHISATNWKDHVCTQATPDLGVHEQGGRAPIRSIHTWLGEQHGKRGAGCQTCQIQCPSHWEYDWSTREDPMQLPTGHKAACVR
mmetsp:Transcript_142821/g.259690  ORF Transcript_142821/g.259690 Transcript_142821/m.259690 type:complete len:215 (-) Transcript_142821:1373-2017(-)